MLDEHILATSGTCSVIAPAGCGKTELIASTIAASLASGTRKSLVLTHTHAGVRALRQRLRKHGVPPRRVRVDTIAGWCLDYVLSYPACSGFGVEIPTTDAEWTAAYEGMRSLLKLKAIQRVVTATYDAIYVDEYQDCDRNQHEIAIALGKLIPCRILGDPLQGIFAFAGGTLSWERDVETAFPPLGSLETPHRWRATNPDLGRWLLCARTKLMSGEPIDLSAAPIVWRQSAPHAAAKLAKALRHSDGDVVAIRREIPPAHAFAQMNPGYSSMEELQCNELLRFARQMDTLTGIRRALSVLQFAEKCATTLSSKFASTARQLEAGKLPEPARTHDLKKREVLEQLCRVAVSSEFQDVRTSLALLLKFPKARVFRYDLVYAARDALVGMIGGAYASFEEAAMKTRSRSRHFDRRLHRRLVSRTLLVKGLQFDHAFVVDAGEFTGDDAAQHFYVAISRGAKSLSVISKQPVVQFAKPRL